MSEAIEIINKQLLIVRNMIQGSRGRVDKLEESAASEEGIIESLKLREIQLVTAIARLRE